MPLCSSCRQALSRRILPFQSRSLRSMSTAPGTPNAPPATPPRSTSSPNPPDATSSQNPAGPQPFSTPHFAPASVTKANKPPKKAPKVLSRIPGGTELRGLGYIKAQPTILAKEDDEYPPWLWTLLDQPKQGEAEAPKADVAGKLDNFSLTDSLVDFARYDKKATSQIRSQTRTSPEDNAESHSLTRTVCGSDGSRRQRFD